MGKRGPLPKNFLEPKLEVINDRKAPATLDTAAKKEWVRLIDELANLGRICNLARALLIVHCQAYSDYERYSAAIQKHGDTYTTPSGQVKMRPEVTGRNKAAEQLLKTASELGFTPNSRSRMNVPTKPPKTEPTLDEILKGK